MLSAQKMVGRLVDERPPVIQLALQDETLREVVLCFQFFVRPKNADNTKNLTGASALEAMLMRAIYLKDASPFVVWNFLMPEQLKPAAKALVDSIRDKCGSVAMAKQAAKKPSKKKAVDEEKGGDTAVKKAMTFFS